jgi:hypothetical protein
MRIARERAEDHSFPQSSAAVSVTVKEKPAGDKQWARHRQQFLSSFGHGPGPPAVRPELRPQPLPLQRLRYCVGRGRSGKPTRRRRRHLTGHSGAAAGRQQHPLRPPSCRLRAWPRCPTRRRRRQRQRRSPTRRRRRQRRRFRLW